MDKKDFKPHMMYDPKTGKGYMAKKYADHVKMDKMGYTHDKPEMIVKSKKTIASLRRGEETIKDNKHKKGKTLSAKDKARALASPANRAMSAKQVKKDLEKKNPPPWMKEDFDFKVNIDGFPEMFMSGNSPGEVKAHLRKLVKQPSMIQSVDRVTKHDKKKHHRDKVNEGMKYTHAAIDKSGKVIGMASQESDAKDMARRNQGRVVKLKKPMSDKKGDMMINRQFQESLQSIDEAVNVMKELNLDEGKMKQLHQYMDQGKSAAWIAAKMKLDLKTVKALIGEQNRYQSIKTSIGNFLSRVKNKVMGNRPTGSTSRANLRAKGVNL
jgi:hypothetical protein